VARTRCLIAAAGPTRSCRRIADGFSPIFTPFWGIVQRGIPAYYATYATEQKPPKTDDIHTYVCKDIMRSSGEDRAISLAFLHGYFLGKKGTTTYRIEDMQKATDQFVEYCLDHPTTKALEAMSKFVQ
jgi:hypothetical protein